MKKLALLPLAMLLLAGAFNDLHTPASAKAGVNGPPCPDSRLCPKPPGN
jgi:hypothetical protein